MSKGTRRERQAVDILKRVGYATYRPATVRFGENDVWGMFDVLAIAPHRRMRAVQVKSNRAVGIRQWSRHTRLWRGHGWITEYWVPVDNRGWRVLRCTGTEGYETVYDGRESDAPMGEGLVSFLRRDVR